MSVQFEELKPCPFCGVQPKEAEHQRGFFIGCMNENCVIPPFYHGDSPEECRKVWNTRPIEEVLETQILEMGERNE